MAIYKNASVLGTWGEQKAEDYLVGKGYWPLARNYYFEKGKRFGEIDIITKRGDEIVFVEVKTRQALPGEKVLPEEQVDHRKLVKLARVAEQYLTSRGWQDKSYHFDVVAIVVSEQGEVVELRHLEHVF